MKRLGSARGKEVERRRTRELQSAVRESAKKWIDGLDAVVSVDYGDMGGDRVTMTITGIQKSK